MEHGAVFPIEIPQKGFLGAVGNDFGDRVRKLIPRRANAADVGWFLVQTLAFLLFLFKR